MQLRLGFDVQADKIAQPTNRPATKPKTPKKPQELFQVMDDDQDGLINAADLHRALDQVHAAIDPREMQQLLSASDLDGRGRIDYEQFLAAMLDSDRWGWPFSGCVCSICVMGCMGMMDKPGISLGVSINHQPTQP